MEAFKVTLAVVLIGVAFANKDDIKAQNFLAKFGYYNPFAFDGSSNLGNAIKSFQNFYGLPETGVLDKETKAEMDKPRCGMPDLKVSTNGYYGTSSKWRRTALTYHFDNTGRDLSSSVTKNEIAKAFKMWSDKTSLTFREVSRGGDIKIGFFSYSHGDNSAFDGQGRVLAHAYFPENGRLHFDESETWAVNGGRGTDLLWVAVHEIGHALGLQHSNVRGTVMWPSYTGYQRGMRLHNDDIAGIRSLYGSGTGGTGTGGGSCQDKDNRCSGWRSYCRSNSFVKNNCKRTCNLC